MAGRTRLLVLALVSALVLWNCYWHLWRGPPALAHHRQRQQQGQQRQPHAHRSGTPDDGDAAVADADARIDLPASVAGRAPQPGVLGTDAAAASLEAVAADGVLDPGGGLRAGGGADAELLCVDRALDCSVRSCTEPLTRAWWCKDTCKACAAIRDAATNDTSLQLRVVQRLSPCQDLHPSCSAAWVPQGRCESEPSAMLQLCQAACGFCNVTSQQQRHSVPAPPPGLTGAALPMGVGGQEGSSGGGGATGDIEDLAAALAAQLPPACADDVSVCAYLAQTGLCNSSVDWVRAQCQLSCGGCTPGPAAPVTLVPLHLLREPQNPAVCIDYQPECGQWKAGGKCSSNANYMQMHCRRSCGLCAPPPAPPSPPPPPPDPASEARRRADALQRQREADAREREAREQQERQKQEAALAAEAAKHLAHPHVVKLWGRRDGEDVFGVQTLVPLMRAGCGDTDARCAGWAKSGECGKNSGFMLTHCGGSCDACVAYKLRRQVSELRLPQNSTKPPKPPGPVAHATLEGIPMLGFGTAGLGARTKAAVSDALGFGYRLIDSAEAADWYREEDVGAAIADSGVPREELFIISKIHPRDLGTERTRAAARRSLQKLRTNYHDLLLLHYPECFAGLADCPRRPGDDWRASWRVLESLVNEGAARFIGVSNFDYRQLLELLTFARVPPAALEARADPLAPNTALLNLCLARGIVFISYSTLGTQWTMGTPGKANPVLSHDTIQDLADAYDRSPAQVVLRWALQRGMVVLPRSGNTDHIADNNDVWGFELSGAAMKRINALESSGADGANNSSNNAPRRQKAPT